MTLKIENLRFDNEIPRLPKAAPLVSVMAPDYSTRERGMTALAKKLELGETSEAHTEFGRAIVSSRGEVEYFHGAGAVWATDLAASEQQASEMRKWSDLVETKGLDGAQMLTLGRKAAADATALARETADMAGFDLSYAGEPVLDVQQVAQFSENGKELQSGGGEATMVFPYMLEGLPVLGAGAKTLIDMAPDQRGNLRLTGAVNVWRSPKGGKSLTLGGTEAVMAAGLFEDPDLNLAIKRGGSIVIEGLRLGLMALPATMRQELLFPVLEVFGRVELPKEKVPHYNFGRICPAATMATYAKAGIYADFLSGVH